MLERYQFMVVGTMFICCMHFDEILYHINWLNFEQDDEHSRKENLDRWIVFTKALAVCDMVTMSMTPPPTCIQKEWANDMRYMSEDASNDSSALFAIGHGDIDHEPVHVICMQVSARGLPVPVRLHDRFMACVLGTYDSVCGGEHVTNFACASYVTVAYRLMWIIVTQVWILRRPKWIIQFIQCSIVSQTSSWAFDQLKKRAIDPLGISII